MRNSLFCHTMGEWMVKHSNMLECVIAADMIRMSMRVDNHHWFVRHCFNDLVQVTDTTTRIDERRPVSSNEQIHESLLVMTRLMENKKVGSDLVALEPIVRDGNLFECGPN